MPPSAPMNAPHYPYEPPLADPDRACHSRLGIASLILGLLTLTMAVLGFAILMSYTNQYPQLAELRPGDTPPADLQRPLIIAGVPICTAVCLSLVGLALGIAGVSQSTRLRHLAFVGTCLNGLILAACVVQMLVGFLSL